MSNVVEHISLLSDFLGKAAWHKTARWRRSVQVNWVFACKEVKVWVVSRKRSSQGDTCLNITLVFAGSVTVV